MKFCNAMDSPKVAINEGRGSVPSTRFRTVRCISQPMIAPMGTSIRIRKAGPSA